MDAFRAVRELVPDEPAVIYVYSLMYFAVWKTHIGVYPVCPGPPEFEVQVRPFRDKKDTPRLDLRTPVPYGLVETVARFNLHHARGDGR